MQSNKPENEEMLAGHELSIISLPGHIPAENKAIWTVIKGLPSLFFVDGVLPKPGQRVEMVCTASSETEVHMQLRAIPE